MDVHDADVHSQTGLAIPERVVRLRGVGHVVGGLEAAGALQVFDEHVARRFYSQTCVIANVTSYTHVAFISV